MNIGEAAKASGLSAKMIRHYERTGLVRPADRTGSNYRVYRLTDVAILRFVKQARRLGFSIGQIAAMLELWQDRSRPSGEVERLINRHLAELDQRIRETKAMKETVEYLASHCRGDLRPECPILDELAENRQAP
ncbi:MerR family copper efflux transcriptional regulator [Paraburkholderia sp. BL23I1N1]|uniref:Cu(I)-responsive transcriptional regulator n=1 Tax=Paraburkholderia sp. BL23I1N1 TaxID=1938802 RepID=UPI000E71F15D|nr:Cu(I)-responsive transcriptional regulator [Paraburkholderia sp. BL23I1N1]RKE25255.1 MerR family copper efflux transcriptional regulator [Paraburkholderia sp. BL23I1N1]